MASPVAVLYTNSVVYHCVYAYLYTTVPYPELVQSDRRMDYAASGAGDSGMTSDAVHSSRPPSAQHERAGIRDDLALFVQSQSLNKHTARYCTSPSLRPSICQSHLWLCVCLANSPRPVRLRLAGVTLVLVIRIQSGSLFRASFGLFLASSPLNISPVVRPLSPLHKASAYCSVCFHCSSLAASQPTVPALPA